MMSSNISVLVAGDYCPTNRVSTLLEQKDLSFFEDIKNLREKINPDLFILNLECPIVSEESSPIKKNGPNLRCSESVIDSIKYIGANVIALANNHINDFGPDSILNTKSLVETNGIKTVGVGANLQQANEPLIISIKGKTLAIINCAEHEFSIASEDIPGANPLDPIQQYYQISALKNKVDYILLYVHGGREHYPYPTERMQKTYRYFIDIGVDAIVNTHQHCVCGYEIYKGKPIFYGIGNFCFDKDPIQQPLWNEGLLVKFNFSYKRIEFDIFPIIQCKDFPKVTIMESSLREKLNILNAPIKDNNLLAKIESEYAQNSSRFIKALFQPYNNRLLNAAYKRGLLPNLIGEKKFQKIKNYILCESHIDLLQKYFSQNDK